MRNKKRAPIPEYRIDPDGNIWDGHAVLWDVVYPCAILCEAAGIRELCVDAESACEVVARAHVDPHTRFWRVDLMLRHLRFGPLGIAAAGMTERRATKGCVPTYGIPDRFY